MFDIKKVSLYLQVKLHIVMVRKIGTRRLQLNVEERVYEFINDYKFNRLVMAGRVLTNEDVLAEAVESLERELAQQGVIVAPRPQGVRDAENMKREMRINGYYNKQKKEDERE